jgi:RNA 2',3'-cyclic 3'-phosphodiesterase
MDGWAGLNVSAGYVRLFFAALPDAGTRERAAAAAESLVLAADARWVPRVNFHVTLLFVGTVPKSRLATLLDIGRVQRVDEFSLRVTAFEYWPRSSAVVAVAPAVPAPLDALWLGLRQGVVNQGWELDPAPLCPHVTLARKVTQAPVLQDMSAFDWPVREFCLMRSDTGGARSAYTVVDTWSLLDNAANT